MSTATIPLPQVSSNLLTHSRTSCAKTCLRKHYYQYELGVRVAFESRPLRMGSAVHLGLELYADSGNQETAIAAAVGGYDELPVWANTQELIDEWIIEREKVARLLSGYFWYWQNQRFEIVSNEQQFRLPIRNPQTGGTTPNWELGGKIDKIVRLEDGRLAVMEHKTCSDPLEPESDYWKRLRIDQQISLYMLAARELGHDVQTVLYDVIRKPSISPKLIPLLDDRGLKIVLDADGNRAIKENILKSGKPGAGHGEPAQSANADKGWVLQQRRETAAEYGERLTDDIVARPTFYFARQEIPRLDADLEEFRQELWDMQKNLRESQLHNRWYRSTGACVKPYRCEYLDICHNGIDLSQGVPAGFVRVENLHPELTDDASE